MLKWIDVIKYANQGNPKPDRLIIRPNEEWQKLLSPEAYRILRLHGTERAFSSEMCNSFELGQYACAACRTLLFDANEKYESRSGWPSFTQPIQENAIAYRQDNTHGMRRIEVTCNTCQSHLGHVFPDGPAPSGLRYCINALSLEKVTTDTMKATFGGGCFWCTEALFQQLRGVVKVDSGYSGGKVVNPTYREVCSGRTGHAEVIEVTYKPAEVSYLDLLRIHMSTHNPTTLNFQGADKGTQYRSIIFYRNEEEKIAAEQILAEAAKVWDKPIVTEIASFEAFYKAEAHHQDYYKNNTKNRYCQRVIEPKLVKFKEFFEPHLK